MAEKWVQGTTYPSEVMAQPEQPPLQVPEAEKSTGPEVKGSGLEK